MPIVKVWNDNVHDFKQSLKGEEFVVPAKGFIEMEYEEAIDFKGAFSPMPPVDFSGDQSLYFKMIRVESPPPNAVYREEALVNHLTGQKAATPAELEATLAQVRHLVTRDPELEKGSADKDATISALQAQVAELAASVAELIGPKRGPGRPKKEA